MRKRSVHDEPGIGGGHPDLVAVVGGAGVRRPSTHAPEDCRRPGRPVLLTASDFSTASALTSDTARWDGSFMGQYHVG